MLTLFYRSFVLAFPKTVLTLLCTIVFVLGYGALHLEIDASSDTLLLEQDKDLAFARDVAKRYGGDDFLVIAYTPKAPLLSESSLHTIASLSEDLLKIDRVKKVISLLNVPLLQSPPRPVKELVDNVLTLESKGVDFSLAQKEFLLSPLYRNNLVSKDFSTTAILVYLKPDLQGKSLEEERLFLREKKQKESLSPQEKENLSLLNKNYKEFKDAQRLKESDMIDAIRERMHSYQESGNLFLGGVNMIAVDLIRYVKNDLILFGSLLLALVIVALWFIFKRLRWIGIPVFISLLSVLASSGVLGWMGWEVTVISSNFVSLQLIITLSVILHLMVRYRELSFRYTRSSQHKLILHTMLSKANPSFFAIITTIAGFSSLILSGILPVINLGWMMSVGIALSLLISFIAFPAILILLEKEKKEVSQKTDRSSFSLITIAAFLAQFHRKSIVIASIIILVLGIVGGLRLKVENSFIDYFKENTAIYQGMKVIDQHLGGTTPLDVIVRFKQKESVVSKAPLDEFDAEFDEAKDTKTYWFTPQKIELIHTVHTYLKSIPHIGSVHSLATMLEIGKTLNDQKPLDSFELALLHTNLPSHYRQFILDPYIDLDANEARFSVRIVDSNPELRRNELLAQMQKELSRLVPKEIAEVKLSGLMVLYNNMLQSLFFSQIVTLGFVVVLIWGMFIFLFRSFLIATIAIVANIVPIAAVFGFMGWLGIPLDMMTITIASISVGIGVDDTIHYIHRFERELHVSKGNYLEAMRRSFFSIGYGMYYTSLAIMAGFFILVISNFIPTIYFGLLTVFVMFVALLCALLLLPTLLLMFKPFKR